MGRAIDQDNRLDDHERRLKLLEAALEEMIQTRMHNVDLHDEIEKHEDLETLLVSDVEEEDYVHAAIKFERKKIKEQESSNNEDGIFGSLKRYSMDKRYNKSYDELYDIYSKAYQNAQKHKKEGTSDKLMTQKQADQYSLL